MRKQEKMHLGKKHPMLSCLAILTGLTVLFSSCATNKTALYPINGKDIYAGKNEGDVCFSSYYLNEILQVKINNR